MDTKIPLKKLVLALACGSFALSSLAQWQWVDKDGRKVFSDRPPPSDVAPANILKQPSPRPTTSAPVSPSAPSTSATPAAALLPSAGKPGELRTPVKDSQLESRKKQAEEEEAARKRAEDEVVAKARAENCERAKKGLVTFESGVRIAVTNAKGEREFMDDASRATETKRLQSVADSDCKK